MSYIDVINHCDMTTAIKNAELDKEAVMEEVMDQAGKIIYAQLNGKEAPDAHEHAGIQLMATSVALHSIEQGAKEVAGDVDIDLEALKQHAAKQHISAC